MSVVSELDWMEDWRKRSESLLQAIQHQSPMERLKEHYTIVERIQQALEWMNIVCLGIEWLVGNGRTGVYETNGANDRRNGETFGTTTRIFI